MPGKESDLPSRADRKVMGKKNVRGRMAGELPFYESDSSIQLARPGAETDKNAADPRIDQTQFSMGYARDL